jgi:hypothetical protein
MGVRIAAGESRHAPMITLEGRNKALACDRCNTDKGRRMLGSRLYRLEKAGDPRAVIVRAIIGTDRCHPATLRDMRSRGTA